MNRRSFLKGAGVVTVVVVGGGVWRAYDQGVFSVGEGPAYEPWKDWRNHPNEGNSGAGACRDPSRQPTQHAALALQGDEFFD
jgi:hypothetical protein